MCSTKAIWRNWTSTFCTSIKMHTTFNDIKGNDTLSFNVQGVSKESHVKYHEM